MKRLLLSSILVVLAATPPLVRADLEMVQEVVIQGAGKNMDEQMIVRIKGDRMRVDMGEMARSLVDTNTGEVTTIMPAQKVFMRMSGDKMQSMQDKAIAMLKQGESEPEDAPPPELKATGKKETIHGFEAAEYVAEAGTTTARYWIAKDYPNGKTILKQMNALQKSPISKMGPKNGLARIDIEKFPGVPVRTVVKMQQMTVTSTIVSIEEKDLDASLFEIPEGYTEMQMPMMGMPDKMPAVPPAPVPTVPAGR